MKNERRWADLAFAVVAIILLVIRYRILAAGGAPPTIDGGDWLAHGDALFGVDIRSDTIVYPPVVPVLVKLLVAVFGLTAGVSLAGALASVLPATGIYIALRLTGMRVGALGPSLLVLGASSIGEAAAWGGFPQLIGFGLAPILLVLTDRAMRTWSIRDSVLVGILATTLLATSHFVSFATALAALALVALRIPERALPPPRRLLACSGVMVLPALWLAPTYVALGRAFAGVPREFRFFDELTWPGLWDAIEFLYRDLPIVWFVLFSVAIVAPLLALRLRTTTLWRVTTASLIALIATLAVTREARFVYFLTPYAGLALALFLDGLEGSDRAPARRLAGTTAVALLLVAAIQLDHTEFFKDQRDHYGVLTPGLVEGIEWAATTTPPDSVLAITSLDDSPVGRWVEAIADRETFYGSPLQWLLFEVDLERADQANRWFVPPFPTTERVESANDAGVDLILVPTRWVFYDEDAVRAFSAEHPDAIVVVNEDLIAIEPARVSG